MLPFDLPSAGFVGFAQGAMELVVAKAVCADFAKGGQCAHSGCVSASNWGRDVVVLFHGPEWVKSPSEGLPLSNGPVSHAPGLPIPRKG